jgi:phospholipase/carboxylesterase
VINRHVRQARLAARPRARPRDGAAAAHDSGGIERLRTGGRDALLAVPPDHDPARAAPLAVMLHGAGGTASQGLQLLSDNAAAEGFLVLAPASAGGTWDVIVSDYGRDVTAIDHALADVFDRYAVDAKRIALGGFSDGASYALSLGLSNGDLFTHVVAFSPGFVAPAGIVGRPAVFVSHGARDAVLPIDRCSRRIVPELERLGYDVTYREFEGAHAVPPDIREAAARWILDPQ